MDLSRLPTCRDSLILHIARVNYRLASYKRVHKVNFLRSSPYDSGQGWEKTKEGVLEPVWSCGPVLPTSLIDLPDEAAEEADEVAEEEEEQEIDYEILLSDDK